MPVNVVLFEPEIPPNTGNVIRLCANTGAHLHLVEPLGFSLDDRRLKRAGLDYHEWANLQVHESLADCLTACGLSDPGRVWAFSTRGQRQFSDATFQREDVLLFGPETRGLPDHVLQNLDARQILRLPMRAESRSLNLSNTVAVGLYEAWRQLDFVGGQ